MRAGILNYGGIVESLTAPDRAGQYADVVLGMDSLEGYLEGVPYFGALVGRYGNRIAHARFTLDGKTYTLPKNDGDNTLHGGNRGFDKRVWNARASRRFAGADLSEPRRRRRLPRQPLRQSGLHPHAARTSCASNTPPPPTRTPSST